MTSPDDRVRQILGQRIPLVLSPNRNDVPGRIIRKIVVHTMEYPEGGAGAEWCARYFTRTPPKASAHYLLDADSTVQGVPLASVAWAAPGANHDGIQIEVAGYAGQTTGQWDDAVSRATIDRLSSLVAALSIVYGLPLVKLDAGDLRAGRRGVTGHHDVTLAYRQSDHWDPGPNFPWRKLITAAAVRRAHYTGGTANMLTDSDVARIVAGIVNAPLDAVKDDAGNILAGAPGGVAAHAWWRHTRVLAGNAARDAAAALAVSQEIRATLAAAVKAGRL